MTELYDTIGKGYERLRMPDPRIARAIGDGLGQSARVVNVGAGAGSYEPRDRFVVAVEPSAIMIGNRASGAAPAVRASATQLPFQDASFDAALAVLTMHHWPDWERGLSEMRRVTHGPIVLLTWDPAAPGFWLTDYFPEILDIDRQIFPQLSELRTVLGKLDVRVLPIPHDCTDGFLGAYWRRPEAYLRREVRAAISTFSKLKETETGLASLRADLESGAWLQRYGGSLADSALDLGYRLVVA